ncbi:MAG: MarR family transcriptional regulator [Actinobacteria bacterium]|nr:MarR family transcriptional regulator [Actinomycetota bacterium]
MKEDILNEMADELVSLFPLLFKNLMKFERDDRDPELSRVHMDIMFILNKFGQLTMSDIANRLLISKPYNTLLVDKLIDLGLVERLPDSEDRRIVNIRLTEKGIGYLREFRESNKENIKRKLSTLGDSELKQLLSSLRNIKEIISKI